MKIQKWIDTSQQVEIELSSEDIHLIFDSEEDSLSRILSNMNSVATLLKGIPDAKIKEMGPDTRKIIVDFLTEQVNRYGEPAPKRYQLKTWR